MYKLENFCTERKSLGTNLCYSVTQDLYVAVFSVRSCKRWQQRQRNTVSIFSFFYLLFSYWTRLCSLWFCKMQQWYLPECAMTISLLLTCFTSIYLLLLNLLLEIFLVFGRMHVANEMKKLVTVNIWKKRHKHGI